MIFSAFRLLTYKQIQNFANMNPSDPTKAVSIFEFSALDIDGNVVNLSKYDGQVTYIVNVASK